MSIKLEKTLHSKMTYCNKNFDIFSKTTNSVKRTQENIGLCH